MQDWKRSIPTVTAASLAFGGSSCGGGVSGPGADVAEVACRTMSQCDPLFFDYYDSIGDCEGYLAGEYQGDIDAYEAEGGPECADAYLAYILCYWNEYEATCNSNSGIFECDAEDDAFELACD
jgi:hypothetical protein